MDTFEPHAKEKFVQGLFAAIARRYDLMNTLLSFNRDKYWRQFTIAQTGLQPGGCGLDVCCGTGLLTAAQAQLVGPAGKVVGLDFCPEMLAVAEANIAGTPYRAIVDLVEGNAMSLPFADGVFDCATIGFALRNVPDIKAVLAEMRRVVRPGGRVVSLELAKPGTPGLKQLYYLYFERILPLLGKLGAGVDGPYRWLPESLRLYPHQTEVLDIFKEIGLQNPACFELTGGIVAVHVGSK